MNFEKLYTKEKVGDLEALWSKHSLVENFKKSELLKIIEEIKSTPEAFIGEGGAAKVYALDNYCVKVMKNRNDSSRAHMYDLGNHPIREFELQIAAQEINTGTLSPEPIACLYDAEEVCIIMERLEAKNLQFILNGKDDAPKGMALNKFETLEKYVGELHDLGIAHNDLEARNIMVDSESGDFFVIDFGRSLYKEDANPTAMKRAQEEDFDNLDAIYDSLEKLLTKK